LEVIESEGEPIKVRGIAQKADFLNENTRVYPLSIFQREVPLMMAELDRRPGLANHPEGPAAVESIALRYTNVWMEDNKDIAFEAVIVPTRAGKDIESIAKAGVQLGISSRGFGSVKKGVWEGKPAWIVQDDFELVSFDVVLAPSVTSAYMAVESIEIDNLEDLTLDILGDRRPDLVEEIESICEATWDTKFVNSLPDAAFAVVLDGGKKDGDGKTMPRSLRKLPHHNESVKSPNDKGSVDMDHLKNALARCPQMKVSADMKAKAQAHLDMHKKQFGMESRDTEELMDKEVKTEEAAVVEATDVPEVKENDQVVEDSSVESDVTEAVVSVELTEAQTALEEAKTRIAELETGHTALMEDAANLQAMMDLMTKEVSELAAKHDFYGAASIAMMGDTTASMHDRATSQGVERLATAVNAALESLGVQNLHSYVAEKCRVEKNYFSLVDALKSCRTKEEVDSKFDELKAILPVTEAATKAVVTDEAMDPLKARQVAARDRYRGI
jgi:hypothetical protein